MLNEEIKNLSSFLFHLGKFRQKFNCIKSKVFRHFCMQTVFPVFISYQLLKILAWSQYWVLQQNLHTKPGLSIGSFLLSTKYFHTSILPIGSKTVLFHSNEAGRKPNIETGMKLVSCHVHSPYHALYWYKVGCLSSSQRGSIVLQYECIDHQTTYHAQACIEQSISQTNTCISLVVKIKQFFTWLSIGCQDSLFVDLIFLLCPSALVILFYLCT